MSEEQKGPYKLEVKKGEKKSFCLCDATKNPPFCDGAHSKEAEGKRSCLINFDKDQTVYICGCKQSKNRPFCDGSHNSL